MASGIRVQIEVGQELHKIDQSWKITLTATNANNTGGVGVHDNNIFVMRKGTTASLDTFMHIAKPRDMLVYPDDRADVPPKEEPYFRTDSVEIFVNSADVAEEAVTNIKADLNYLIDSLDFKEIQGGSNSVDFGTIL